MARREISILGFAFLDAMTCGFGAVVLLFMIINASVDLRATQLTSDLRAEADRLEEEVLDGHENLVELRNSLREIEDENVLAQGLSRRMIETIEKLRVELATYDQLTLARREHINQLMSDLKTSGREHQTAFRWSHRATRCRESAYGLISVTATAST